jgi:hypothetical protein
MLKRMSNWLRRIRQVSWLGGLALFGRLTQEGQPPDQTQNTVAIVIVIAAIALPFFIGGGIALVTWLISLGTPTQLVSVEQKKVIKREILPEGVHMPPPSSRPFVLSLGIMLICVGLLLRGIAISLTPDFSIPIILVIGVVVMLIGLLGWVGDDLRIHKGH